MPNSLNDDMLKQAVLRVDQYYISNLPNDIHIDHRFSHKFKRKMKKLIRHNREEKIITKPIKWRKRLLLLITCLLFLFASTMSVSAVRKVVFEFISNVYEKYTEIFFSSSQPNSQGLIEVYKPVYIPNGFVLNLEDTDEIVYLEYVKDNEYILYEQENLDDISLRINTEDVDTENTSLNGLPAIYYSNQGMQNLLWYDDMYLFSVSSTLNKDEVFRVAESVQKSSE